MVRSGGVLYEQRLNIILDMSDDTIGNAGLSLARGSPNKFEHQWIDFVEVCVDEE